MKFETLFKQCFIYLYNRTALHIAIENKDVEMVKLLLSNKDCDVKIDSILIILLNIITIKII